jgi:outer membrane protein assembly factor BamD (BamD/ComL family)
MVLLASCASNDNNLEQTIGSLDSRSVQIEPIDEPQVEFTISRQQAIKSYRSLVAITEDGIGTGNEIRRLADLELEASLDSRFSDDATDQKQGEQESQQAIRGYERYLKRYPNRKDNDYILYQLSRAYAIDAKPDKSLRLLNQLVSNYPESHFIDEVQFRRGEKLFVLRQYEQAEAAYSVIVKGHPDSKFYEKALYKYGWSQFKQGRYGDAIDSYISMLDLNAQSGKVQAISLNSNLSRAERELLGNIVKVASLAFSYQADKISLADYFNKNGQRQFVPLLYLNLGELYQSKERVTDSADVYLAFGKRYPYSKYTAEFHERAVDSYQKAGFASLLLQEKIEFVNRYDIGTQYWSKQDQDTHENLQPILTRHLNDLATHFHAQARKSKKADDYKVAANWYRHYLRSFPNDKDAAQINFLLAESLYDAKQYSNAIAEYEKTAYEYPTHKDSAEAGYAALLTYDALFQKDKTKQNKIFQQKRVASALKFSQIFSQDARMPLVLLQSAQQFFEWKDYPNAIQAAYQLADNIQLDRKTQRTAWTIIGHSHFGDKQYANAEQAYLTLLTMLSKNSKQTTGIQDSIAASIYKQGEAKRMAGNHLQAAHHFTRLGNVVPNSPTRIIAEYDATTAFIELKDWPQAVSLLEKFRKRYPKQKKWQQGVSEKLALAYSQNGNNTFAAKEMIALSSNTKEPKRKRDLMWRAAELYQDAGQKKEAISIYKSYVKLFPKPLERSIELQHRIAESYKAKRDNKNRRYWLNQMVIADANGKAERSPRSKYLAATATIELTKPLQQSFQSAKLTVPLKKSLKKKKKLMQQSIKAYTRAINYQVEEVTTEATFQIAEIYNNFANALLNSQRPNGLDEEQLEEYNLLLEEQAYPFEEKAIDIHISNFKRIPSGTYDQSVKNSLQVLGKLMPFRYAKKEAAQSHVELP